MTEDRMKTTVVKTADVPKDEFDWGSTCWAVSGKAGNSATLTFGRVVVRAGMSNPRHGHETCDEILYHIKGQIEHYADDLECAQMAPGDVISIPAGVYHNARCIGDEDAEMVVVYSAPQRDIVVV